MSLNHPPSRFRVDRGDPVSLVPLLLIAAVSLLSACVSSPLRQVPPKMPESGQAVLRDAANGGRVQSIAVNPGNRNNAIIAMQFGGMWKTYNAGDAWFRVYSLPAVYVTDVAYGADGQTVVATVFRDNQTQPGGGGGIYISTTNGDFWSRPPSGIVPTKPGIAGPTSGYSVSAAPDERGLWYAGTDYGVAVSQDNGASWTHRVVSANPVHAVLAFPGGSVLALEQNALWRSDDRGASWRVVIGDDFSQFAPMNGNVGLGGNKMDRAPNQPWAFILREFRPSPAHGSGKLWFYELDTDTATALALPQGRSRGPFVRVSNDELFGGNHIRVWVGAGWDGYYVIREDAASIRALLSTADWDDWVSFIAEAGIHADMGDLGLDADFKPALMGTDGGIYRPRPQDKWWNIGGKQKWMSAAAPGSGMNSLQISDLGGTNFRAANGNSSTSLYITTQDNQLYTSPDGGVTWRVGHGSEGFGLEGRADALAGEPAQIAFIGTNSLGDAFAETDVGNVRPIPRVDENGVTLDRWQNTHFVSHASGEPTSNWVRRRAPSDLPVTEVYFSNNNGDNWRKFATANFKAAGEVRTVATVAWLPVFLGGPVNPIGLVPLSTATAPGLPPPTYDDSDAVWLPNGSLGQRFTEFDKHAIFGVHPTDWTYLIAPDIVANNVKVSRDGGKTWNNSPGLTAQVLRGGALRMWGGKADLMQVTEVAFDPYDPQRILVATRDAGIACSADGGRIWRTIYDSDKIQYITGLHFLPNGAVFISSYGHGLWRLQPTKGCPKTYDFPWDVGRPTPVGASDTAGVLGRSVPPPVPRGIPASDRPKLFLEVRETEGDSDPDYLELSGRGFPGDLEIALQCREIESLETRVRTDASGRFSTRLPLAATLPYGTYTIEARASGRLLTVSEFDKPHSDEELVERSRREAELENVPPPGHSGRRP